MKYLIVFMSHHGTTRNFFEKTLVKSIYGIKENVHKLNPHAISAFEKTILENS